MNIIEKRKKQLKWFSIVGIVVSALIFVGGIVLVSLTAKDFAILSIAKKVIRIIFGVALIMFGLCAEGYFIAVAITGGAVKATHGSIKEGNECIGTVNMNKCPNCGNQVKDGEEFCSDCGESLAKTKTCSKCGNICDSSAKNCPKCANEF